MISFMISLPFISFVALVLLVSLIIDAKRWSDNQDLKEKKRACNLFLGSYKRDKNV